MRWNKVYSDPRSHCIFRDERGRYSLADYSGPTPDVTDDGPLIVLPGVVVQVGFSQPFAQPVFSVPVFVERTGTESTVLTFFPTIDALVRNVVLVFKADPSFTLMRNVMRRIDNMPVEWLC